MKASKLPNTIANHVTRKQAFELRTRADLVAGRSRAAVADAKKALATAEDALELAEHNLREVRIIVAGFFPEEG